MVVKKAIATLILLLMLIGSAGAQQAATNSGSLAAPGSVTLNTTGYGTITIQLTGTWTGTVLFEGSVQGSTYVALNATPSNASSPVTSATANGAWTAGAGGYKFVRARASVVSSGTVVINLQTSVSGGGGGGGGGGGSAPSGTIGAAVPATASPVAGQDNAGNLAYFKFDGSGNLLTAVTGAGAGGTSSVDGAGYTAGTTAGTPAMGALDDVGTTACAEDKVCIARVTSARALHVNFAQIAGTTTDTNSGNKSAGTLRVVLATDQPQLTNKLLVTPDANSSINLNQVAGAGVATGHGTAAGAIRVELPTDGTGLVTVAQATASSLNAQVVGVAATDAPVSGNPVLQAGRASAAAPTDVSADGDVVPPWLLRSGAQVIQPTFAGVLQSTGNGTAGTGTPRVTIASDNTAFTVNAAQSGSWSLAANQSVNVAQLAGTATSVNSGNKDAGTLRVVLATDQPALTNSLLVNPGTAANWGVYAEDAAETAGGNLMMAGAVRRDTLASSSGTSGDNSTINTTSDGAVWTAQVAATNGGASTCVLQSAASTNATNCKASAGNLYGVEVINTTSTIYYLRLYNSSGSPTCSSSTGFVRSIPIPHASGNGAGIANFYTVGEAYGTGIAFCFTGGGSSTDNTNAATGVYITLFYK